jgi:hypothetical protein
MTTETKAKPAAAKDIQEEILATIRSGQEAVIDAISAWTDAVKAITPDVPGLPELLAKLPKIEDVVGSTYDFAEKGLAGQREFTQKVLSLAAGALPTK